MEALDKTYWSTRWQQAETGWDIGQLSTGIKHIVDAWPAEFKQKRILIPGGGLGYEAIYLFERGFEKVYLMDWAPEPLQKFHELFPSFPTEQLICQDFFELEDHYDILLEQTFFCALPITKRSAYVAKTHQLLSTGGLLTGLLFNKSFETDGPPFGGTAEEYRHLFSPLFHIHQLAISKHSIEPRLHFELEFKFIKK